MNRKERTIVVAIAINALLVLFKLWLAGASGSLALRASALHSGADLAIGVFVLIGLVIGRREAAERRVPARLSIAENVAALGVAMAILYVGFDIVRDVLGGEPPELSNLGVVTFAALVTVGVAWVLARYKLYVGRATESPALIASGYHSRMDIYASIIVVAGLGGAALGIPNLDAAAAAVVAVLIFLSGYQIAVAAVEALRERRIVELEADGVGLAPGGSGRRRILAVAAVLVAMYAFSGTYVVSPGETGVVRRFGEVVKDDVEPGLRWRWPWPVERADVVSTATIERHVLAPALVLTGDDNLVSVQVGVHYRIMDAARFLVAAADPRRLVDRAAEEAVRRVVGSERVDGLLTTDKSAIERRAAERLQQTLDGAGVGLRVTEVQLLRSDPPPAVASAFRDVASAREDRNTFINEAVAFSNEVIPQARADAAKSVEGARAYAIEKTSRSAAEAAAFSARQRAYTESPTITRDRLYLEAAEGILAGARKFIVDPAVTVKSTDLWIRGRDGTSFPPRP